jgi:hypothetical protein
VEIKVIFAAVLNDNPSIKIILTNRITYLLLAIGNFAVQEILVDKRKAKK